MGILDREEVSSLGLTEEALAVVEALIAAPVAWVSPAFLAHHTGLDRAAVFCGLADLEAAGLVDHWETEAELTVTLSPIGAALLGVHLVEVGPEEVPRWALLAAPQPAPPKAKGIFRDYDTLSLVVGPTLPPGVLAEIAEETALAVGPDDRPGRHPGRAPRLVGDGLPWPGRKEAGPCLVCSGSLKPDEFCLCCSTAGKKPARSKSSRARAARRFARSGSIAAVRRRAS